MSSHGEYFKDLPGVTAGSGVHVAKMIGGADSDILYEKLNDLKSSIDQNQETIETLLKGFSSGRHAYGGFVSDLQLANDSPFEKAYPIHFLLKTNAGKEVWVPLALHIKPGRPEIVRERIASDFAVSFVFEERKKKTYLPRTDTRSDPLGLLVQRFKEDWSSMQSGPNYLEELVQTLSEALSDPSFLNRQKSLKLNSDPSLPDSSLTAAILLAFLNVDTVGLDIWEKISQKSPELRFAYARLIVVLAPQDKLEAVLSTAGKWSEINLDSPAFHDWIDALRNALK